MQVYENDRYSRLKDETLAQLAADGDSDAVEVLLSRYIVVLRHAARGYNLPGIDADDLFQEAAIALLEAVRTYNKVHGVPFRSYAAVCMKRKVASVVRSALRKKNFPEGGCVSFDESFADGTVPIYTDEEMLYEPEILHIMNEERAAVRRLIQFILSDLEKKVLSLYLACVSYEDIAEKLGISVKSVDNALQRIRRKLRSEYRRSNL